MPLTREMMATRSPSPTEHQHRREGVGAGLLLAACATGAAPLFVGGPAPGALRAAAAAPAEVVGVGVDKSASGVVVGPGPVAAAGAGLAALGAATAMRSAVRGAGRTAPRVKASATATATATPAGKAVAKEVVPEFDPATQLGAIPPLGFFDPLGFSNKGDEMGFRRLREAELKHGRVAMMASIGLLGQHFVKLPGLETVPSGLTAVTTASGALGFLGLACIVGVFELAWRYDPLSEAGTFGGPRVYSEDLRTREISNGRFAMISVLGILAAEIVTGKDAIQQFGF